MNLPWRKPVCDHKYGWPITVERVLAPGVLLMSRPCGRCGEIHKWRATEEGMTPVEPRLPMRHRGRSRPFTARRRYWPKHCGCIYHVGKPCSIFDVHRPGTLAPPVMSISKPSGLVDGDVLYMSGVPENVAPPGGWTRDGNGWRKVVRTVAPRWK